MSEQKRKEAKARPRGRLRCLDALSAMRAVQRLMPGAPEARPLAEAQGLALAGARAAAVLDPPGMRILPAGAGPARESITLSAATVQEAVDHCLAAHLLASRHGVAVTCLLEPGLAEKLGFARLPEAKRVKRWLDSEGSTQAGRKELCEDLLKAEAQRAIAEVCQQTGLTGSRQGAPVGIGVTPGGEWGRELLLETVALAAEADPARFAADSKITLKSPGGPAWASLHVGGPEPLDVLVMIENAFVDPGDALGQVREGGKALVCGRPGRAVRKDIQLFQIIPPGRGSGSLEKALQAGLLGLLGVKTAQPPPLRRLERRELASQEAVLGAASDTAWMASQGEEEPGEGWLGSLREFHLTGQGPRGGEEPWPGLPLWPAAAEMLGRRSNWRNAFPYFLPSDPDSPPRPLLELLEEAAGDDSSLLKEHLGLLVEAASQALASLGPGASLDSVFDSAFETFLSSFAESSEKALGEMESQSGRLRSRLPREGALAGYRQDALPTLYAWALVRKRRPFVQRLYKDARRLASALEDALQADRMSNPQAGQPDSLAASIGEGGSWLDADALSGVLPAPRGPTPLSRQRRERLNEALGTLRRYLRAAESGPAFYVLHAQEAPSIAGLPKEAFRKHSDPCAAALGFFDGLMLEMASVWRALRIARLEAEGLYEPERHDAIFARFDWQSCTAEELLAAPPVAVLESAPRLAGGLMPSLSRLLRSPRPIHVLVGMVDPVTRLESRRPDLSADLEDLGYLAVAHREAFVLQSTLSRPGHLSEGLQALAGALDPAAAFVALPEAGSQPGWCWLLGQAAHWGRATPCFRYAPAAGPSWAERFSLEGNPQYESRFPVVEMPYSRQDSRRILNSSFAYAHAASLNPNFRSHFRVLGRNEWADGQLELAEYLSEFEQTPPSALPFIWILAEDGELKRALATREMAAASRERLRSWKILQELAGVDNEYVRRAESALRARLESKAEAERQAMLEQARREGAERAIEKLVAALTGGAEVVPPAAARPSPEREREEPARESQGLAAEEPCRKSGEGGSEKDGEEKEGFQIEEAYIDSALCTSCNDCIQLNPLMFVYNDDKQAEIGDLAAGTYAELVQAAELCPARCIHPGAPAAGDESATPEVVARARKLEEGG